MYASKFGAKRNPTASILFPTPKEEKKATTTFGGYPLDIPLYDLIQILFGVPAHWLTTEAAALRRVGSSDRSIRKYPDPNC
jgi:hypothetical protein